MLSKFTYILKKIFKNSFRVKFNGVKTNPFFKQIEKKVVKTNEKVLIEKF